MANSIIKKFKSRQIRRLLKIPDDELAPYYAYYLGEITIDDLTDIQQEKLTRYSKIWSQYLMGRTQPMILGAIMKEHDVELRQAQYDLSFAIRLHGPIDQVNKDGRRVASREFFDLLAQLAMKDKQYQVAVMARDKADHLAGLHKEEKEGFDPEDFAKPAKIVYNIQVNHNYSSSDETIELDE